MPAGWRKTEAELKLPANRELAVVNPKITCDEEKLTIGDDTVSDDPAESVIATLDFILMFNGEVMLRFPPPPLPVRVGTLKIPVIVPPVSGTNSLLRLIGEQAHPAAVQERISPMLVQGIRLRLGLPLAAPPSSPLPVPVVIPVIVPTPGAKTISSSGGWLSLVFSLLSKVALSGLFATSANPSLGSLFSSRACTA